MHCSYKALIMLLKIALRLLKDFLKSVQRLKTAQRPLIDSMNTTLKTCDTMSSCHPANNVTCHVSRVTGGVTGVTPWSSVGEESASVTANALTTRHALTTGDYNSD